MRRPCPLAFLRHFSRMASTLRKTVVKTGALKDQILPLPTSAMTNVQLCLSNNILNTLSILLRLSIMINTSSHSNYSRHRIKLKFLRICCKTYLRPLPTTHTPRLSSSRTPCSFTS